MGRRRPRKPLAPPRQGHRGRPLREARLRRGARAPPSCKGSGSYKYTPYSATESKVASNENELLAALPLGASSFAGRVKRGQTLRTDYTMVGTDTLPANKRVTRAQLRGPDCPRATHVVSTVYLGGFALAAGTKAELGGSAKIFGFGAEGESKAAGERLVAEGNAEACAEAQKTGKEARLVAPFRCASACSRSTVSLPMASASRLRLRPPRQGQPTARALTAWCASRPAATSRRPAAVASTSAATASTQPRSRAPPTRPAWSKARARPPARARLTPCSLQLPPSRARAAPDQLRLGRSAKVYCQAHGKLLPTVNDLEWAARGNVMRTYPWGEEPPEGRACFGKDATCAVKSSTGATPKGVFNLGGNVEELSESPGGGYLSFGGGYAGDGTKMASRPGA